MLKGGAMLSSKYSMHTGTAKRSASVVMLARDGMLCGKPANKGEGRNSLSSSFKAYENTSLAALCSKRCCTNPAN